MEAYRFVLCCVLFATAACWSIQDRSPDSGDGGLPEVFQSHNKCKRSCSNGRCVTDNKGNVKCICKSGYALQEEFTCKKCDCGSKGKCLFTLTPKSRGGFDYEKKCVCDVGSAEKDGKCIDCYCGNNSACEFNGEEKNCYCIEGYSEKDGVCTKCDCGFYGTCEFKRGIKQCECDEGFLVFEGVCEECDCGEHGTCTFMNGAKYCQCKDGYQENAGICEECNCGDNSIGCRFSGGVKQCDCKEKFSDKGGSCEVCDCGPYSFGCSFFMDEQKCQCEAGYVQKRNSCEVACGYDHPCQNGGSCGVGGYCKCLPGTSGEFCEVIEDCDRLCPEERDVRCAYDAVLQKPFCECLDHTLRFDPERKKCHRPCDETAQCMNRGVCTSSGFSSFCRCIDGTEGEFCEVVTGCKFKDCGGDAECKLSFATGEAFCFCKDFHLFFDQLEKRCRKSCNDTQTCRNGGYCEHPGLKSFCRCRKGTEGDFCEQVPECDRMDCGTDARCGFNVSEGRAACQCRDPQLAFDPQDRRCKRPCDDTAKCMNRGVCTSSGFSSFCRCIDGTEGEFCEVVTGCQFKDCGSDAECKLSFATGEAFCFCKDFSLFFDELEKRCRKPCNDTQTCRNGGYCEHPGLKSFCRCKKGTEGDFCEQVPECDSMDCGTDARCEFDVSEGRAACQCRDPQLRFDLREMRCKNFCQGDAVCAHGGRCEGNPDFKFCYCLEGIAGDYCEIVVGCNDKDCGRDAVCGYDASFKTAVCSCLDSGKKFDEESKTCRRDCQDEGGCRNGGSCHRRGFGAFCDCLPGTGGDLCETVDDCKEGRTRCEGGALCVFDQSRRKGVCECPDGKERYDTVGEKCKLPCDGNVTCHNAGLCRPRGDHTFCECKVGTSGHLCETVDDCRRGVCGYGSDVECLYDVAKEAAVCRCRSKQHLFDPVSKTCKACDCGKKAISCRYEDGRKVCLCRDGYDARNGTCQKARCMEKSCHNGQCRVVGDEEVCSCFEGYTLEGDHCKKLNCSKTPCFNGTCIVRHGNREECVCQAGYTLKDGACIRGACRVDTCFGGYCDVIDGELMCVCPKNYSLQGIGCFATVCRKQHCFGGWCYVDENKEEICTCHKGYVLVNDVCKKILCNKPCFGGQCQFVDGKEECICPPGYTIFKDVCRDDRIPRRKTER